MDTSKTPKKKSKKARPPINFRYCKEVKEKLEEMAMKENIDPSDIYRRVFTKGLEHLYNFKVEGNELVN